jgi:Flp pilus assembly protein TadB
MWHRTPAKKKTVFPTPIKEWQASAPKEEPIPAPVPAAAPAPRPAPRAPEPEVTTPGDYTLFRGALTVIAICTVAVAGLTFIQHGNLLYVLVGLAAGVILYALTEWLTPLENATRNAEDLKDSHKPNKSNYEEG